MCCFGFAVKQHMDGELHRTAVACDMGTGSEISRSGFAQGA